MPITPEQARRNLQDCLLKIPDGRVSQTARDSTLTLRQIMKLREGKSLDVRISTLVKLAPALGLTVSELLGETEPPVRLAQVPEYDRRVLERLLSQLAAVAETADRLRARRKSRAAAP